MTDAPRILLIDENARERELTALVLRENVPRAEIVEVSSGLDYALGLAQSELQFAIAAPHFTWGEGPEVLNRVRRRHPRCEAILLADEHYEPDTGDGVTLGYDFYRKSSVGLAELARVVREGRGTKTPAVEAPKKPRSSAPDPYDHLWSELQQVRSLGQALVTDESMGPKSKRVVTHFLHATGRLEATIEHLFGEHATSEFDRAPTKLADVVLAAMRVHQPMLRLTRAKVQAGKLPVLIANHHHLLQLILHLLDNALKFRSASPPRITIRAQKKFDRWQISVADNGIGIASRESSLFDMFSRAMEVAHLPGTGIGLAVCKSICKLYDGDVRYESNSAGGTTFFVDLCVQEVAPDVVRLAVHCNGRKVGDIEVMSDAGKNQLTRAALGLPALNAAIGEQTLKDVQLLENAVLNIVV